MSTRCSTCCATGEARRRRTPATPKEVPATPKPPLPPQPAAVASVGEVASKPETAPPRTASTGADQAQARHISHFRSIFSEGARSKLSEMELSYLMQVVFRVFLKRGARDPTSARSYVVQALISPGVNHHELIDDLARAQSAPASQEAQRQQPRPAEPPFIATSEDLTLEMVNDFLARLLAERDSRR